MADEEKREEKFVDEDERSPAGNESDGEERELPLEGTDPKVLEFLRILDEYRLKNEDEGNYAEAERASNQLDNLRTQEMKRQLKALKARQIAERQDVQIAHNMQYAEFNASWDKYMEEYDQLAQTYIQQMTEKHAMQLREFQDKMQRDLVSKPPKFSKELLDWRRREKILAKQKNYAEAQKIKRIADMMEAKERGRLGNKTNTNFLRKEKDLKARQKGELKALLKRIELRRKEHLSQRNADSKRLLQRNRNVQAVLESKQSTEMRTQKAEIKVNLSKPLRESARARRSIKSSSYTPDPDMLKSSFAKGKKRGKKGSKRGGGKKSSSTTFMTER